MLLKNALKKACKLAKTEREDFYVWFDDDYNTYRVCTESCLYSMYDRNFITPNDVVAGYDELGRCA
jgi:hypothetical protein